MASHECTRTHYAPNNALPCEKCILCDEVVMHAAYIVSLVGWGAHECDWLCVHPQERGLVCVRFFLSMTPSCLSRCFKAEQPLCTCTRAHTHRSTLTCSVNPLSIVPFGKRICIAYGWRAIANHSRTCNWVGGRRTIHC